MRIKNPSNILKLHKDIKKIIKNFNGNPEDISRFNSNSLDENVLI